MVSVYVCVSVLIEDGRYIMVVLSRELNPNIFVVMQYASVALFICIVEYIKAYDQLLCMCEPGSNARPCM